MLGDSEHTVSEPEISDSRASQQGTSKAEASQKEFKTE